MKALLVIALGIAGVAVFGVGAGSKANDPLALPLVIAGGVLVLAALVWAVMLIRGSWARRRTQAIDSPDALARWTVSQADMDAFRGIDAARSGRIWSLKNALKLPGQVGPAGWPVVVGEQSLVLGDLFVPDVRTDWSMGEATWHEGNPGFIELSTMIELAKGETIMVHRFPVPAAARAQAAAGFEQLRASIAPSRRERIHRHYANHFAAAAQTGDDPHPIMRRRKYVIAGLAIFFALMIGFLFLR